MTNMEKQIDLLVRYATTDDEELKKQLRDELAATIQKNPEEPVDILAHKLEDTTEALLDEVGVPHHLLGRNYIVTAIHLITVDPDHIHQITDLLYPAIAVRHDTTASRVERAIRHAIESAWDRGNYGVLKERFGNTVDRNKGKPTNSQFLAACDKIVRRRMRDAE